MTPEQAAKLDEIADTQKTICAKLDAQKKILDRHTSQLADAHRTLLGDPPRYDDGLASRVRTIEQNETRRAKWIGTAITAAIVSAVGAAMSWIGGR